MIAAVGLILAAVLSQQSDIVRVQGVGTSGSPLGGVVSVNCVSGCSGGGTQNVNLIQVGGASISLGQTTMSGSIPVVIASNQSALTVNQGNSGSNAQAWWAQLGDTTNGPVAVKPGSTAAAAGDKALVVAISPNNTPTVVVSGTVTVSISNSPTVNQGNKGSNAQAWWMEIGDGTNGPAAVKAGNTAAVAGDPALVVAISPNNTANVNLAQVNGSTTITTFAEVTSATGIQNVTLSGLQTAPFTNQSATSQAASPYDDVAPFTSATYVITWTGTTGSPTNCTMQPQGEINSTSLGNNGPPIPLTPGTGAPSQGMVQTDQGIAPKQRYVYTCSVYPSAGTFSMLVFYSPAYQPVNDAVATVGAAVPRDVFLLGGSDYVTPNVQRAKVDSSGNLYAVISAGGSTIGGVTQVTIPWVVAGQLTNNNAAPAANNVGVLPALAQTSAPSYSTGNQVLPWVDLGGRAQINMNQVGGTATVTGGVGGLLAVGGPVASGGSNADNPVKVGGVFNSTQPTVTNGQIVDLQATARGALIVATGVDAFTVAGTVTTNPPANASTNVAQFGGNAVVTGTGASGLGIPRVTVSNDSVISSITNAVTVSQPTAANLQVTDTQGTNPWVVTGSGTAGTPASGVVTVQGITNGTVIPVSLSSSSASQGVTQITIPWVDNVSYFGGAPVRFGAGPGGFGVPRFALSSDSQLAGIVNSVSIFQATNAAAFLDNLTQVGGASISLGQAAMSGSIPVVIASNQSALSVTQGSPPWTVKGDVAPGSAASTPIQLAAQDSSGNVESLQTESTARGPLRVALYQGAVEAAVTASAGLNVTTNGFSPGNFQATVRGETVVGAAVTNTQPFQIAGSDYNGSPAHIQTAKVDVNGLVHVTLADSTGTSSVNVAQVGGVAIALGQTNMANSVPVTLAFDQTLVDNVARFGGGLVQFGPGVGGFGVPRVTVSSDSRLSYLPLPSNAAQESNGNLAAAATSLASILSNQTNGSEIAQTLPPRDATTSIMRFGGAPVQFGAGPGGFGIPRFAMSSDSVVQVSTLGRIQAPVTTINAPECTSQASFSQTSSARLVTGAPGQRIRICSILVVSATAQNISLVEGKGTLLGGAATCATNTTGLQGGSAASVAVGVNGGWSQATMAPFMATQTTGDDLCLLQSGSGNVSGGISYTQYPDGSPPVNML